MAYSTTLVDALSIFTNVEGEVKDKLALAYDNLLDQIQKEANYYTMQNTNLSGNVQAGTVKVNRLSAVNGKEYGTARAAGKGDKVENKPVDILLNEYTEYIEEYERADLMQHDIADLLSRRTENFSLAVARELDTAFFTEAEAEGSEVSVSAENTLGKISEIIISLETVKNVNVDGVDRSRMVLAVTPQVYEEMRSEIDAKPNPRDGGVMADFYHGVRVVSNFRQTKDVIAMTDGLVGAVALPTAVENMKMGEPDFSNAQTLELYIKYGVKAVYPDLIKWAKWTETPSA